MFLEKVWIFEKKVAIFRGGVYIIFNIWIINIEQLRKSEAKVKDLENRIKSGKIS